MSQHVSSSQVERFCVRALPVSELTAIAEHIGGCPTCHQQLTETLRRRRSHAPLKFTLAPEFWFRHEHIDYEQLVGLADKAQDAAEQEIIGIHLKVCASCNEDVRSFLEFRAKMDRELEASYSPVPQQPTRGASWMTWWRGLAWKPIYAAAIVLIGIALVIGAGFFLKRRANNFQAKQTPTPNVNFGSPGQTTSPDSRAGNSPSPATLNEPPVENSNSSAATIALNDGGGTVTVDKSGNLSGLDDVPAPTRDEIARVLVSKRLEQPVILKQLGGQEGSLRGSKNTPPFRLTSPLRTVIITDRPTLRWEKASGASSYIVYVNDPSGHEVARSEELASERTQWALPKSLKRGGIYTWTVVAIVDGKETVSPGPSLPEMKFQVLSASSLQQLNKLKKTRSHLGLGIFYAREGMIPAAKREFRILVRENPHSLHASNLLKEIQSWQRR